MRITPPGLSLLILIAAFALSGCNLVISQRPLFFPFDAAGAPPLKAGVWAMPEVGCAFVQARPVRDWPECARGMIWTGDRFRLMTPRSEQTKGKRSNDVYGDYVLAAGSPRIEQLRIESDETDGVEKPGYIFMGLTPLAFDKRGRIIRTESWLILCGPPPEPGKPGEPTPSVTKAPLPGMTITDSNCAPRDADAVRAAALPSRAWRKDEQPAYWVRDGLR